MMKAFRSQVIFSTMKLEENKQEKGLKRQKLKNEYTLSTKIKRYGNRRLIVGNYNNHITHL